MAEKIIKTRIINKHAVKADWDKATNFIPKQGEIIIYDDLKKIKIGDGETTVVNLDFMDGGVEIDTSDFVSKSETDSQYLSSALEVLDYFGITNSNNGDYYLTLGSSEIAVGDGNGEEYIYTFDNQGGVIATQEWVQANAPSIDTSKFVTTDTEQTITGHKVFKNADLQTENWNGTYSMNFTYQDVFDANGSSALGLFVHDQAYGEAGFLKIPELNWEAQTIATQEWVQANAPSVDTSNFVTKDDSILTLKDSDTYENGWMSLDASTGTISYNPYPGAFWSPTITLDMSTADPSDQEKNANIIFNLPMKQDGTYTLATTDMIGGSSDGNYVELGTRPTTYLSANPSQTIYTDINIGDSESSGYVSYNLTTWGWYGGYIKLNPGSPAIEVQTPMASTSRSFQFPETGGTFATQAWVENLLNGEW